MLGDFSIDFSNDFAVAIHSTNEYSVNYVKSMVKQKKRTRL